MVMIISQTIKLKLVSAIYQIFIFSPNNSPSNIMKTLFKKLFLFSRYSIFWKYSPSFPHLLDFKGQTEVE